MTAASKTTPPRRRGRRRRRRHQCEVGLVRVCRRRRRPPQPRGVAGPAPLDLGRVLSRRRRRRRSSSRRRRIGRERGGDVEAGVPLLLRGGVRREEVEARERRGGGRLSASFPLEQRHGAEAAAAALFGLGLRLLLLLLLSLRAPAVRGPRPPALLSSLTAPVVPFLPFLFDLLAPQQQQRPLPPPGRLGHQALPHDRDCGPPGQRDDADDDGRGGGRGSPRRRGQKGAEERGFCCCCGCGGGRRGAAAAAAAALARRGGPAEVELAAAPHRCPP